MGDLKGTWHVYRHSHPGNKAAILKLRKSTLEVTEKVPSQSYQLTWKDDDLTILCEAESKDHTFWGEKGNLDLRVHEVQDHNLQILAGHIRRNEPEKEAVDFFVAVRNPRNHQSTFPQNQSYDTTRLHYEKGGELKKATSTLKGKSFIFEGEELKIVNQTKEDNGWGFTADGPQNRIAGWIIPTDETGKHSLMACVRIAKHNESRYTDKPTDPKCNQTIIPITPPQT